MYHTDLEIGLSGSTAKNDDQIRIWKEVGLDSSKECSELRLRKPQGSTEKLSFDSLSQMEWHFKQALPGLGGHNLCTQISTK
jgi:hypothetical protein